MERSSPPRGSGLIDHRAERDHPSTSAAKQPVCSRPLGSAVRDGTYKTGFPKSARRHRYRSRRSGTPLGRPHRAPRASRGSASWRPVQKGPDGLSAWAAFYEGGRGHRRARHGGIDDAPLVTPHSENSGAIRGSRRFMQPRAAGSSSALSREPHPARSNGISILRFGIGNNGSRSQSEALTARLPPRVDECPRGGGGQPLARRLYCPRSSDPPRYLS
jgi:hypothetical protein